MQYAASLKFYLSDPRRYKVLPKHKNFSPLQRQLYLFPLVPIQHSYITPFLIYEII